MPDPGAQRAGVASRDAGMDAAEVEAAGGMEGGGTGVRDLADALADALEAGYAASALADYGAAAAQDIGQAEGPPGGWGAGSVYGGATGGAYSPGEQQRMDAAAAAEQARQAADMQAAIAASTAAGSAGPGTTAASSDPNAPSAFVDDFSQIQRQAEIDIGAQDFGFNPMAYGTMATEEFDTPTVLAGTPYDANEFASAQNAPNLATGPEMFGGWNQGVAQGYNFAPTQQGHPDFQSSADIFGTGVESFAGMPGAVQAAPTSIEESEMGMAAPIAPTSPNVGMITAATGPYGDPAGRVAKPGAITAGTVTQDAGADALPVNFVNQKVAEIAAKVNTPETNTAAHKQVAQSRLDMQKTLDEKAKADPWGRVLDKHGNKTTVNNRQLATAYRSFDTTLAAYATINGQNSLVSMITNNLPGVNAATKTLGGITQGLINRGIFNKTSAEDIVSMIAENLAAGARPGEGSQWGGGEGGMEAEMAVQQQVSSFIQQYPWAAELDPKYIKYLIDNPAELQDLLGEAPGGGTPVSGGGGQSAPAGFTQKPGQASMALVEWSNPSTGETWTAPNGSWQGPPGWVQV